MIGTVDLIPASVLIIEKHPLMREALCAAIADEPDLKVGMHAASGAEVLQISKILLPDVILFALGNPGLEELKTLKTLCETLPETPILVLTSNEVWGEEQAALEAGACEVLTKAASRAELISKLREIWRREIMNDSDVNLEKEADRQTSP